MTRPIRVTVFLFAVIVHSQIAPAQWTQTNGPTGGHIRALSATGENILAGTLGAGIFRSSNNGASWTASNSGLENLNVNVIVTMPDAEGGTRVFAGTQRGLFLSVDDGGTWTPVNTGLTFTWVYSMTRDQDTLYVGTNGAGVFRSTDMGTNWTEVNTGLTDKRVNALHVNEAGHLFAGTLGGVFRSMDKGSNWAAVNIGLTNLSVFALHSIGTDTVFAGSSGGVFRSTTNGDSWVATNTGLSSTSVRSFALGDGYLFVGTNGGVYRSTNHGDEWTNLFVLDRPGHYGFVNTLLIDGSNLFAGNHGTSGVLVSPDYGDTWNVVNAGIVNTTVPILLVTSDNEDTTLLAASLHAVFTSGAGINWTRTGMNAQTSALASGYNPQGNHYLYAGGYGTGVFYSVDGGTSWDQTGLTSGSVSALATKPDNEGGTDLFAAVYGTGIQRSADYGANWTDVSSNLSTLDVVCLAIMGDNILTGTETGGVFLSTNNGQSWEEKNEGLTENYVSVLFHSGTNLFAGTYDGVFHSSDTGATWVPRSNGLTSKDIVSLAIHSKQGGSDVLFAGTASGGVFLSTDHGESWTEFNTGLVYSRVPALEVIGTTLFAATYSGGVWQRSLTDVVTSAESTVQSLSDGFRLLHNFPNPFNPTTTIEFELPTRTDVSLIVYDYLGREIQTLVEGQKEAGRHRISFDASALPTGVFFCRIRTQSSLGVIRMVLVK